MNVRLDHLEYSKNTILLKTSLFFIYLEFIVKNNFCNKLLFRLPLLFKPVVGFSKTGICVRISRMFYGNLNSNIYIDDTTGGLDSKPWRVPECQSGRVGELYQFFVTFDFVTLQPAHGNCFRISRSENLLFNYYYYFYHVFF